jgi:hypothetical protein
MAGARDVASFGVKLLTDEAAFRRSLTHPVLLWESPPATREAPLLFSTRAGQKSKRPSPGRAVFFFVEKSVKNAFADEVTVGRTKNNDIAIEENSVSRFHAYFAPDQNGKLWSVVDAKSTAGTFVAGKRLLPKTPVSLSNEMRIRIGEVELRYLEPDGFVAYLRTLIRPPK